MIDFVERKLNQLNQTMRIMQTDIDAINHNLQYVVETPMIILVPSSDEIDDHRSEFSKMHRTPVVQLTKKQSNCRNVR